MCCVYKKATDIYKTDSDRKVTISLIRLLLPGRCLMKAQCQAAGRRKNDVLQALFLEGLLFCCGFTVYVSPQHSSKRQFFFTTISLIFRVEFAVTVKRDRGRGSLCRTLVPKPDKCKKLCLCYKGEPFFKNLY